MPYDLPSTLTSPQGLIAKVTTPSGTFSLGGTLGVAAFTLAEAMASAAGLLATGWATTGGVVAMVVGVL